MYNFFQNLNVIDKIIIIFLVGFHGNRIYQMKEKVICYIIIMVAMYFFAASKFYDFFNQYCSNLLKNPTVRGLMN